LALRSSSLTYPRSLSQRCHNRAESGRIRVGALQWRSLTLGRLAPQPAHDVSPTLFDVAFSPIPLLPLASSYCATLRVMVWFSATGVPDCGDWFVIRHD